MSPLAVLIIGLPQAGKSTLRNYLTSIVPDSAGASCSDVLIDDLAHETLYRWVHGSGPSKCEWDWIRQTILNNGGSIHSLTVSAAKQYIAATKEAHRAELIRRGDAYCSTRPEALAMAALDRYCRGRRLVVLDGIRRAPELSAVRYSLNATGVENLVVWVERFDRPDITDNTTVTMDAADIVAARQIPSTMPGTETLIETLRAFLPSSGRRPECGLPLGDYYLSVNPSDVRRRPRNFSS